MSSLFSSGWDILARDYLTHVRLGEGDDGARNLGSGEFRQIG